MMIQLYLKQGWALIRQNKFYTLMYVMGTALAITMVMVMAIVHYINTANIAPETQRSRMLIVARAVAKVEGTNYSSGASLSHQTLEACYYNLERAEGVAAVTVDGIEQLFGSFNISTPGSRELFTAKLKASNAYFFRLFRYAFIAGKPYTETDFRSEIKTAVLSESLARKLFQSTELDGRSILINNVEFAVSGIVRDVSDMLPYTSGDIWVPYTSLPEIRDFNIENVCGLLKAFILAKSPGDFDAIRDEIIQKSKVYNLSLPEYKYVIGDHDILSHFQTVYADSLNNLGVRFLKYGLIALLFLLVPAINLSGLIASRMQDRLAELGIRKAFGANRHSLLSQVLTENFLLTLMGGAVGLAASALVVSHFQKELFGGFHSYGAQMDLDITFSMLFNLPVFLYSLALCVLLNILSSVIPVISSTRKAIVSSLFDK